MTPVRQPPITALALRDLLHDMDIICHGNKALAEAVRKHREAAVLALADAGVAVEPLGPEFRP